jgi:hypothetical protein
LKLLHDATTKQKAGISLLPASEPALVQIHSIIGVALHPRRAAKAALQAGLGWNEPAFLRCCACKLQTPMWLLATLLWCHPADDAERLCSYMQRS